MDRDRLFRGNLLGVLVRLVLLSVIAGIVMSALGIDPVDIVYYLRLLADRISRLGFGVFETAFGYFLVGAVVVIPVWIVVRLLGTLGGRRDDRRG